MTGSTKIPFPKSLTQLKKNGFDSISILHEIEVGRSMGVNNLLPGIALVDMKGINNPSIIKIKDEILAARNADGLILSWDLWRIPLEYLDIIRTLWEL